MQVCHASILFVLVTIIAFAPKSQPTFLEQLLSPFLWVSCSLCAGFLGLSPKVSCPFLAKEQTRDPSKDHCILFQNLESERNASKTESWWRRRMEMKLQGGWLPVPVAALLLFSPKSAPSASLRLWEPPQTLTEIPLSFSLRQPKSISDFFQLKNCN